MIIHAMCGVSGSGKSTFAAKLAAEKGWTIVCPDSVRKQLTGDEGSQAVNDVVFRTIPKMLKDALAIEGDVIYDATCYNVKNRKMVEDIAISVGAQVVWHVFQVPLAELIRRQSLRTRQVPTHVIVKQFNGFTLPTWGKTVYH